MQGIEGAYTSQNYRNQKCLRLSGEMWGGKVASTSHYCHDRTFDRSLDVNWYSHNLDSLDEKWVEGRYDYNPFGSCQNRSNPLVYRRPLGVKCEEQKIRWESYVKLIAPWKLGSMQQVTCRSLVETLGHFGQALDYPWDMY